MQKIFSIIVITLFCYITGFSKTIYVNAAASGNNNGNNWTNAYTNLQTALQNANNGDNIWVAAGTYIPGSNRTDAFRMKNGVSLYGGFEGTESTLNQRNPFEHTTILSGEIGTVDEMDNTQLIVQVDELTSTITISGFTISGGYSTGFFASGLEIASSSPIISLCTFENNAAMGSFASGGAVTITGFDGESKPQFLNCIFRNNFSNELGGAIHSNDNTQNQTIMVNCLFDGNEANRGGAIHVGSGTVATYNCTFVNNKADKGSSSYSTGGTYTQHINAIAWDANNSPIQRISSSINVAVTYSIVRGGFTGTGNLSSDPRFISSTNYGLSANSPARDAGDPNVDPADLPAIDVAGNNRVTFGKLDIGAYEYACSVPGTTLTETTCDEYVSTGGRTYTESGTYEERYANVDGCDSVVTLNLTITKAEHTITETACESFELNGKTYTQSGTFEQILQTSGGCDSTLTIELTINKVNAQVTQNGNTLFASAGNATYQWVDCDNNNAAIDGETSQSFTATEDGNYAVEVTQNGCTKLSRCINLTPTSTSTVNRPEMAVYPNPATTQLTVEGFGLEVQPYKVVNLQGKVLLDGNLNPEGQTVIAITDLAPGMYFLQTPFGRSTFVKR